MTNGIVTFVQGLVGMKVFAELRAGTTAFGILLECDHFLNLRIRNAIILRARKAEKVEEFFVSGRHLRYIHLAHAVDANKVLSRAIAPPRKKTAPPRRETFR
ncbi:hypothetical protein Y032_0353g3294 [Ancylostoma ceylanicum]|nr:hypothetical protein Y032_0353g3294 [Ancylostoma ceylanicum]